MVIMTGGVRHEMRARTAPQAHVTRRSPISTVTLVALSILFCDSIKGHRPARFCVSVAGANRSVERVGQSYRWNTMLLSGYAPIGISNHCQRSSRMKWVENSYNILILLNNLRIIAKSEILPPEDLHDERQHDLG